MANYFSLEAFYHGLVTSLRQRGAKAAITSGMACVHWGVAQTTQDCDLLLSPDACDSMLEILEASTFAGRGPSYRGSASAPLNSRWLSGGWTSHFHWGEEAYLDLFAVPPRRGTNWEATAGDFYVSQETVAWMKLTARAKDWPFATALGLKMLEQGDTSGFLHIHDPELLELAAQQYEIPEVLMENRPTLRLARDGDARTVAALAAEQYYWQALDRLRLKIYQTAVRPYAEAVRSQRPEPIALREQQSLRVELAQQLLVANPLRNYGLSRFLQDGRDAVAELVNPALLAFLPDVTSSYGHLFSEPDG